jgi:hypothetical protein
VLRASCRSSRSRVVHRCSCFKIAHRFQYGPVPRGTTELHHGWKEAEMATVLRRPRSAPASHGGRANGTCELLEVGTPARRSELPSSAPCVPPAEATPSHVGRPSRERVVMKTEAARR